MSERNSGVYLYRSALAALKAGLLSSPHWYSKSAFFPLKYTSSVSVENLWRQVTAALLSDGCWRGKGFSRDHEMGLPVTLSVPELWGPPHLH